MPQRPPEHAPLPTCLVPDEAPRLVVSVSLIQTIEDAAWPLYVTCPLDEAWLERLHRLHQVAWEQDVELTADEPGLIWDKQPDTAIGSSRLMVGRGWFRFQGWAAEYGQGYVETDDLAFGRVDAAIGLLLAGRRLCQRTGSGALAAWLASLTQTCSDREIQTCLLATGDLYAGIAQEQAGIEERVLAARAAHSAALHRQPG